MGETNPEVSNNPEKREKGSNVKIIIKFLRHGERTKDGLLTDYGRDVTRQRAQESGIGKEDFDAVRAIGSTADTPPEGMGRALETADIYSHEVAGDDAFNTKKDDLLNYQTLLTSRPYDHVPVYNSYLPENFNELSDEEKVAAAKVAQIATVNHLLSLTSPEALNYKKEIVGAYASVIDHYSKLAQRLKSGSRVLIPAGTHGGNMELILKAALIRTDESGQKKVGFEKMEEIGGEMDPSEAFNVSVETDSQGELLPLSVIFDNPDRPKKEMSLDPEILSEAQEFYIELHEEK